MTVTKNPRKKPGYRVEIFRSNKDSQWYFHARAANGEIILTSEGYHAKAAAKRACARLGVRGLQLQTAFIGAKVLEDEA